MPIALTLLAVRSAKMHPRSLKSPLNRPTTTPTTAHNNAEHIEENVKFQFKNTHLSSYFTCALYTSLSLEPTFLHITKETK